MSFQAVQQYFDAVGLGNRVIELEQSSATVELAAQALGCAPKQIAKTMSFLVEDAPILIVTAGDAKIDNKKYKSLFHQKAKPGGVCPFLIQPEVKVYLDVSLKRFSTVYPAAGSGHSAVNLNLEELMKYSHYEQWVDVCKGWDDDPAE